MLTYTLTPEGLDLFNQAAIPPFRKIFLTYIDVMLADQVIARLEDYNAIVCRLQPDNSINIDHVLPNGLETEIDSLKLYAALALNDKQGDVVEFANVSFPFVKEAFPIHVYVKLALTTSQFETLHTFNFFPHQNRTLKQLLTYPYRINPFFTALGQSVLSFVREQDSIIEQYATLREPSTLPRDLQLLHLANYGYPYFNDSFKDVGRIAELLPRLSVFEASSDFGAILSLVTDCRFTLNRLWNDTDAGLQFNTDHFYSTPPGLPISNGGPWYPTSHVEIIYSRRNAGSWSVADQGLNYKLFGPDHDPDLTINDLIALFYNLCPINMVLYRIIEQDGPQFNTVYQLTWNEIKRPPDEMENNCGPGVIFEGGEGITRNRHFMGSTAGTVYLVYDAYEVPDKIEVFYHSAPLWSSDSSYNDNKVLLSTTDSSNEGILSFTYTPTDPYFSLEIVITAPLGSHWAYILSCPGQTAPTLPPRPEGLLYNPPRP